MLQGPLIDGIREEGNDVLCPGNSAIISIALASEFMHLPSLPIHPYYTTGNQIGVKGLESFVEVLKYQKDTAPLPHGVGLLTVQLQVKSCASRTHTRTYQPVQAPARLEHQL